DRLQRRILARGAEQALLLETRHLVPVGGDRAEDALLVRAQRRPGNLGRVGIRGGRRERAGGEQQRRDQLGDFPSHARKSWSMNASGGSSCVSSCASSSPGSDSRTDWKARVARRAAMGSQSRARCTIEYWMVCRVPALTATTPRMRTGSWKASRARRRAALRRVACISPTACAERSSHGFSFAPNSFSFIALSLLLAGFSPMH